MTFKKFRFHKTKNRAPYNGELTIKHKELNRYAEYVAKMYLHSYNSVNMHEDYCSESKHGFIENERRLAEKYYERVKELEDEWGLRYPYRHTFRQ